MHGSGLRACADGVPVAACCGRAGEAEQLSDLVPGQFLVAGLGDGVGQQSLGLDEQAGQGVRVDRGVAEPVRRAECGECGDGVAEDGGAEVVDDGSGQLFGVG